MPGDPKMRAMASRPVLTLNEEIADPDIFCGGGSVAALTGSSAAALTLLVLHLNLRRKANRDRKDEMLGFISETEAIQFELYAFADRDIAVLDNLLRAQREMKENRDRAKYQAALIAAARTPYEICRRCARLLEIIQRQLEVASRFTVSDLGAAAALANGAIRGAILTTEVNLALLRDESDVNQLPIEQLSNDSNSLTQNAARLAQQIEDETRMAIHRNQRGTAS